LRVAVMMDDYREVYYSSERWRILSEKRGKALRVMEALARTRLPVIVHGSVARGDVRRDSDVDIVILETPRPPSIIDIILESQGYEVARTHHRKQQNRTHCSVFPALLSLSPGSQELTTVSTSAPTRAVDS